MVALLATDLAANTIIFSAADALVFHRVPFRVPERLVEIQRRSTKAGSPGGTSLTPALFDEWRRQTDLFEGVGGRLQKVLFLTAQGVEPDLVNAADITVGLLEVLGVRPRWGRSFVDGDDRQTDPQPVLLAWSLARERFGDPARAVGQVVETSAERLVVVGVMPAEFRYPDVNTRIWRALDPRGPLAQGYAGVFSIARLRPDRPTDIILRAIAERSVAVGQAAGAPTDYAAVAVPLHRRRAADDQRRTFFVLFGAAVCLLLTACANVASLELAGAVSRARTYAIQLALGASRASLVRTALAEGAFIVDRRRPWREGWPILAPVHSGTCCHDA